MFFLYANFQRSQKRHCYQLHWETLFQECFWSRSINSRVWFYEGIKARGEARPPAYLDLTRKNASRNSLVKLRISSHELKIETGRYENIPRDEMLCSLCNCNRIEDETHFLLDCPSFSSIREMFFSKLEPKIPFLRLQWHETLLSHLINSSDYFLKIQLISIISSCFELNNKVVSGIINPTDGRK